MVLEVVLGDAIVHVLCTPFRRILMLQAVQQDLQDEQVVFPRHTRSGRLPCREEEEEEEEKTKTSRRSPVVFLRMEEATRFLWNVGGPTIFYSGALLDGASVFLKFWLQVYFVIPLLRRLPPLPMTSFYMLSTLVHTVILFLPVVALQGVVSALNVNRVTDFVRCCPTTAPAATDMPQERGRTRQRIEEEEEEEEEREHFTGTASTPIPRWALRYRSWRALLCAVYRHLPVRRLARQMIALEFFGRYLASIVHNGLLARLYVGLQASPACGDVSPWKWHQTALATVLVRRSLPMVVSLGVSLLTYPLVTFPFLHFVRLPHYERLRREALRERREEAQQGYCVPTRMGVSPPWLVLGQTSASSAGQRSLTGLEEDELLQEPRPRRHLKRSFSLGNFWVETVFMTVCPVDVQTYLSTTIERHGFLALYSGWAAHGLHTIACALVGGVVHSMMDRIAHRYRST